MAAARLTLFDLFGDPTGGWPTEIVRSHTGITAAENAPAVSAWLASLNETVLVGDVRTGASAERVAVSARLSVRAGLGFPTFSKGWPFVIASMPDVEFRVQPYTDPTRSAQLFASMGDTGLDLLVEGLPVEIRLPEGLVKPHPDEPGDALGDVTIKVGEFEPGRLDDLMIVYRRTEPTSIFVHVRLRMDEEFQFDIQPAVPISFGRCALSEIPCTAVHDFRLIPSPAIALDHHEWLRHGVEPWLPSHTGPYDGLFSVRTVDIDEAAEGLRDVTEFLNHHSTDQHPAAEFVLDDLVVPFHGPFWLPIPRHITVGIRRNVLDPANKEQVFNFDRAPVDLHLVEDRRLALVVESFFYQSLPSSDIDQTLGLTFDLALVWGNKDAPNNALAIGLEEDYTIVTGYRRDFGGDGLPSPGTTPEKLKTNELLHIEIAGVVIIDIMGFKVGLSLGRKFGQGKSVGDSLVATMDLFVSMPPTGASDTSFFRLRGLNGEKVAFAVEGLGWRFGGLHFDGLALPDGVVAYVGPVAFVFSEIGLTAEHGASYLSFSGGLIIGKPAGTSGSLIVRRLRNRFAGDTTQPEWKLDGFFLRLQGSGLLIEAGGYYTEIDEPDGTTGSEFGFTGVVDFSVAKRHHRIGLDLVRGERTSPAGHFTYFLFQAFYAGQIGPFGGIELRSVRFLYADNMVPKLAPVGGDDRQLRYYKWYLDSDPLTVPGDRRLAAWKPSNESWALGVGASASFVALGSLVELDAFVLGVRGPDERGLLVAARLFVMNNKTKPLGYLAIEFDRASGRTSAVLGIDATLDKFMENAPAWMAEAGRFTGTLFLSNDPQTLAIGRLADQKTWLALRFDVDLFAKASLVIGFCLELVEDGPKGFGLTVRLEGLIGKKGVVALNFHAGFGAVVLVFTTGSSDYSAMISIEAAIRFVLFGFLRIGVSAKAEFRVVGASPARWDLTAEVRLETPWWLPDVTWRLAFSNGELAPEQLSTTSSPLRGAAASEPGSGRHLATHLERFDPAWDGTGVAPLHSVVELRAPTRPEAQRLANLAADAGLQPVATDATIAVEWSVAINDRLGLASDVASGLGDQMSGDLAMTYDLVGIAVRRRARFGPDRSWKSLDDRVELQADFSDPGGVQLGGEFSPQVLSKRWDLDLLIGDDSAPKKLLINAIAPFEFTTADVERDERLIRRHPHWPCCDHPDDKDLFDLFHRVSWRETLAGTSLAVPAASQFTDSSSMLRFPRVAWSHPAGFAGLPSNALVAAADMALPGIVARADFDDDAAVCSVRMAWPRGSLAVLFAFDAAGNEVGRRDLGPGSAAFVTTLFAAQGPIRRLELRMLRPAAHGTATTFAAASIGTIVEVDEVAYVRLRDYLDLLGSSKACEGGGGGGGYEGKGKLGLLPNHEYELRFTTRVTITHPSVPAESADVDEFVYVRTKGLPGLNAVTRVGEELDPYVRGAYAGGRAGMIYSSEPITLAFSEDFHVAVPLSVRPPGSADEHTTLLRMQLLVTPDIAVGGGTVITTTADDWVVAHRGSGMPPPPIGWPWLPKRTASQSAASGMVTLNPSRLRLAPMTQRAGVPCAPADPRNVIGTVLVAPPQGDLPAGEPTELWPAGAHLTAAVRVEGAGFVDRRPFAVGDETAFDRSSGSWSVVDGELRVAGSGRHVAVFGETDWDHLDAAVTIADGSSAGIGFGISTVSGAARGLFVTVEGSRLVVRRRIVSGGMLVEVGATDLPAAARPVSVRVTSYDDRLRASVGEAVVDVERGEVREGRLCLVAEGPVAFASMEVRGLDLYRFPVAVSRFRSFGDHVATWSGHLIDLAPNALGPGTTVSTASTLWAETSADLPAAMAPGSSTAERQRLFGTWTAGLGLALTEDIRDVQISRFVVAGRADAILIESPEPLDFTAEIGVVMTRRQRTGLRPPNRPPLVPDRPLRDRLATLAHEPPALVRPPRRPGVDDTILDADLIDGGIRLTLHHTLGNAGILSVIAVDDTGTAQLRRGRVRPGLLPGAPATLRAALVGPLPHVPLGAEVAHALAGAQPGLVLLTTNDLADLLGHILLQPGVEVDVDVPVQVIASGDSRRAIIVRANGTQFATGAHRLALSLSRRRWETTDPADDQNTYAATVTLTLAL